MRTPAPWVLPTQPVTTAMLLIAGVTRTMIDTRCRLGDLRRIRHGVYIAAAAWPDEPASRHLLCAHAEVTANPSAVLSHQSAAVEWGLPSPRGPWHDQPVSVTLPAGHGGSSALMPGVHHIADLPRDQVTRDRDGYDVTTIARTAIDLSAGLELPCALVVLDGAARLLCEGMVASIRRIDYANPRLVAAARTLLSDVANSRRRRSLLAAIALCEPARESAAESLSAGYFELAGLPRPEFQVPVRTPGGTLYPDFYWREQRLVGECDGAVKYRDERGWVLEKQREQILRDLEFGVVRWLAEEIMFRPSIVVDRVGRLLGL